MTKQHVQRATYREANVWPQFAIVLFSFTDIAHTGKNKYLIFVKLENTGQIKYIFDKLC